MIKPVDLRSDTVTKPSPDMRQAMASADVGDDVYGEDPSVNALQAKAARMFGKEAGLFVPTGVMANQLAIKASTRAGDEIIVEYDSHIFQYETAAPSVLSNVQLHTLHGESGVLTVSAVERAVRPDTYYFPRTRMVCIENTHNRAGGTIYPLEEMRVLRKLTEQRGLHLHLDGARIWNAHIATGIPLEDYGSLVDSISVCFSKGLGAPIGSMLLGSSEMIEIAHKFRKVIGGGMRQAGILAAGADFAVENNLPLLRDDHRRAFAFASALTHFRKCAVNTAGVQTNIVNVDISPSGLDSDQAVRLLKASNVFVGQLDATHLRAVFHLDVSNDDLERAVSVFGKCFD